MFTFIKRNCCSSGSIQQKLPNLVWWKVVPHRSDVINRSNFTVSPGRHLKDKKRANPCCFVVSADLDQCCSSVTQTNQPNREWKWNHATKLDIHSLFYFPPNRWITRWRKRANRPENIMSHKSVLQLLWGFEICVWTVVVRVELETERGELMYSCSQSFFIEVRGQLQLIGSGVCDLLNGFY